MLLLFLAFLTITGCRTSPDPTTSNSPPTATPFLLAALTPDTIEVVRPLTPILGQLVLTTDIAPDEAPKTELITLPMNVQKLYLAARVSDLVAGSRFTAIWYRGSSEIARSERIVDGTVSQPRWIALALERDTPLPAGTYSVRLYLNDQFVDSIVFSVGGGLGAHEEVTTLIFTAERPAGTGTIQAISEFPPGTTQIVAVLVNPPPTLSGSFWTRWSVNGFILTEIGADEADSPFLRTFTLKRSDPLPPGSYTVQAFFDQQEIATSSFTIAGETTKPPSAAVEEVRIVQAVDPRTGTPLGAPVQQTRASVSLYVAILVANLRSQDQLDVAWFRENELVSSQSVTGLDLAANWVSLPFDVPPLHTSEPVTYRVLVSLNSEVVGEATLLVTPD